MQGYFQRSFLWSTSLLLICALWLPASLLGQTDCEAGNGLLNFAPPASIRVEEVIRKDSLDLEEEDRQHIVGRVRQAGNSKVIITHGTDTMTVTAAALAGIANKTIVLTGALSPARFSESDAPFNLGMAFAAVQVAPKDVAKGGDQRREAFRKAVATGVKKAKEMLGTAGTTEAQIGVVVEHPEDAHDAGCRFP